ncbi:ComEA family DNA-binding protein [Vibrio hippocampi]|uniref:Transporter n=1 Tax=Vibrio hippocampi TaxID=654686 RepID=A0ABN8DGB0_9VIBR|nr:ComEA family DNA-binding protein [Vibrio hippocampi]CAH0526594.1 hypothetical protein VHP8226_01948 [Vibrio hippocampi]
MKTLLTFIASFLFVFAPITLHAETTNDKYEGIEITVNINTAGVEELAELLQGIGPAKAKDIVEYREKNGDFQSADELTAIKGIGSATVSNNRDRIQL